MPDKNLDEKADDTRDGILGLLLLAFIGWVVWTFFLQGEPKSSDIRAQSIDDPIFDITLGVYKNDLNLDDRVDLIEQYTELRDLNHAADYKRCMGDFAADKSETLRFKEVFGWCVKEAKTSPEKFADRYDELDAKSYSSLASIFCKDLVELRLKSPGSAKHPTFGGKTFDYGKARYIVQSHVDSQNVFGALIRLNYHCDVQYNRDGDEYDWSNWTIHDFELSER